MLRATSGSARVAPSPPPSRLTPDHDRTRSARDANIGASVALTSVSPVLPSLPVHGTPAVRASEASAGSRAPTDGVKSTKEQPAVKAAQA